MKLVLRLSKMANTEKRDYRETLHLYLAFRRRKVNPEGPVMCFREIIRDEKTDLERLLVRVRDVPGVWRVHKTVNARSVAKATNRLMHRLIDEPRDAEALDTVWKTCLLQKEAKAERRLLLDIDDPRQLGKVSKLVPVGSVLKQTPSGGYHIVCGSFDTRLVDGIPDVSIQRDGYLFVREVVVG